MTIRRCTLEDMPWLMEMARKYYPHMIEDWDGTAFWVHDVLQNDKGVFFRTRNAFVMVEADVPFFRFEHEAVVRLFAGKALEVTRIMIFVKEWGAKMGIREFKFQSTTGHDVAKLAKILGAMEDTPTYVMRTSDV